MHRSSFRISLVALLAIAGGVALGAGDRDKGAATDVIVSYGVEGYIQPIGIHHGFHITKVLRGSNAEKDGLQPHDVIIKVGDEPIRGLTHLRDEMQDARDNDEKFKMIVMKEGSLIHHHRTGRFRR